MGTAVRGGGCGSWLFLELGERGGRFIPRFPRKVVTSGLVLSQSHMVVCLVTVCSSVMIIRFMVK